MDPPAAAARRRLRAHARRLLVASATAGAGGTAPPLFPELVPRGRGPLLDSAWARAHLAWMEKKDRLGQDMFLLGTHSPMRRHLAFKFCELHDRECEYVALTADTSEADLKSRRELRRGADGGDGKSARLSVVWEDQAVVRAAIFGRVLVLEGLEKAERNVLPIINNLLENREMALEDGRFLVAPKRFDDLIARARRDGDGGNGGGDGASALSSGRLIRVSPRFRVIAVGVPAPPFPGNPLDPPLRSRFQARHIERVPTGVLVHALRHEAPTISAEKMTYLLSLYEAIWTLGDDRGSASGIENRNMAYGSLCYPSEQSIVSACRLLDAVPSIEVHDALARIFPYSPESLGLGS